jgi:hypothetical protein
MTESKWLSCTDPGPMLEFLQYKTSRRKFRLFAVACCRVYWHLYRGKRMRAAREAVEVAESYADGRSTEEEMIAAAERVGRRLDTRDGDAARAIELACAASQTSDDAVGFSDDEAAFSAAWAASDQSAKAGLIELEVQAALLCEIFGNPFRPVPIEAAWFTPSVLSLAHAAYDIRNLPGGTLDNARLTVLADALEEAACDNADILDHLRSPGPHVRGCFALDLLLGKE